MYVEDTYKRQFYIQVMANTFLHEVTNLFNPIAALFA